MFRSAKNIITALIFLVGVFFVFNLAFAAGPDLGLSFGNSIGLSATDPRIIAARIIQIFLGFLGIIAVGLIIYAGFLWMTAAGNEERIEQAKKILLQAIIGLIIILSSFAIATFILNSLMTAIGNGGNGGNGNGQGNGISGSGVIGACSVESVYPTPNQSDVARNTVIMITFKEAVDPATICETVTAGKCSLSFAKKNSVKLFKSKDDYTVDANLLGDVQVLNSDDNKTFTFSPKAFLGSPSEFIWYTIRLTNGIVRVDNSQSIFGSCPGDQLEWQFQVSNKIDTTPPQVYVGGVFPPPDNARDARVASLPVRAIGSIVVGKQPQFYVEATSSLESLPSGNGSPAVRIAVDPGSVQNGNLKITVDSNGTKATLENATSRTNLGVIDVAGSNIKFPGIISLTADGAILGGNSWTVAATAMKPADTLTVGSMIFTFVKPNAQSLLPNQIISSNDFNTTAQNITDAINNLGLDVLAARSGSRVDLTARQANSAGNRIGISESLASPNNALTITAMHDGADDNGTVTVNGQSDKPRNSVIQINFNEAILPINVAGDASDPSKAIHVLNIDTNTFLSGKFVMSNQYKTVEFVSDFECGVNGCGEKIYCLPADSHLKVVITPASLQACTVDNDCAAKSPYNKCFNNLCAQDLNGAYTGSRARNYPQAEISNLNGLVDAAMNSFDGDRNSYAEGPAVEYSDNPPVYSNIQDCQNKFKQIIDAVKAKRAQLNQVLGDITGSFCSFCSCDANPSGCGNMMAKGMKDLGLPGAIKDSGGGFFTFDENEDEPANTACVKDQVYSPACGWVGIPTYYCVNGDVFSWSFYISNVLDTDPPKIVSTNPVRNNPSALPVSSAIKIDFNKLMMSGTLKTGSTETGDGQDKTIHKNINIWSLTNNPVGYWIESSSTLDGSGIPVSTNISIRHNDLQEAVSFRAQAGSGLRDIYQNCFKPSADLGACSGVNQNSPSCCNGVLTAGLTNGNCP